MSTLFAKNILFLRKEKQLSQTEMPDRLGIKASTWSNYENGNTEPSLSTLVSISKFFGILIDDLLTREITEVKVSLEGGDQGNSSEFKGKSKGNNKAIDSEKPIAQGNLNMQTGDNSTRDWLLLKLMQENSQKLDRLLVMAEKAVKK